MNVFVFDIETVPDVEAGRRLYDLRDLSDEDVGKAVFHLRRQQTGDSEFLRHHLHRIVAISAVLRSAERVKVWSLGDVGATERELVERFFDGVERFVPTLVSWNGSGFDLPVLHYRALLHGVRAARYWETGDEDRDFRWNNYLNRFHTRHTDLMDVLAGYQARANASLDEIATLLGFPGKMGMSGANVWEAYLAGDLARIRDYCETDVLNTYLVYLRFQLMRGRLDPDGYARECKLLRDTLASEGRPHLDEFLAAWKGP
ncbi:MAG: 3'-5' exonuclease [Gammaproteobacteria bacterium]|nr:3'-5' exonuclease [Gammaproteobacteria bacterium]NIR32863.1 3'-5' exonuclease [Gammaproteobacteria bacterium]NIR99409.1 3'-5' exonuclease [Gammaproteobacteria bacterium]NIT65023.1 3'-5' exonuclease [Gammaproteobacteria bacterium]NIV21938.1 3'-5' exonuclease [Gammaproteobacteria bacterium]